MTKFNIIVRLAQLRKKQVDVLLELHEKGIKINPTELSRFINGVENPPKSDLVLAEADKIITEWEKQAKQARKESL